MLGGLHRELRRAYAAQGMLYELHFDLLYQCDLDCEHCYLDDKKKRILSTEFWKGVFDQAAELQVFQVLLSGGEIFLRKDLLELVAHARSRGLFVHLKSHGGHIDADVARRLAELGVTSVWLSYYSTRPEVHDAITRRPGSQQKTRAALHHLAQAGVVAIASIAVMQRNADDWRDVVADCESMGVIASLDGQMRAAHSGAEFPKDLSLDVARLSELETFQLERFGQDCDVPGAVGESAMPPPPAGAPDIDWGSGKNCVAGHLALYVSPEGDVTPCVAWPMPLGNLAKGDRLADLWRGGAAGRNGIDQVRSMRRQDRSICATCEVREDCEFCAGQAWVETRDPNAAIANLCLQTRARTLARAEALGLPEPPMPAGLLAEARPRFLVRAAPRAS